MTDHIYIDIYVCIIYIIYYIYKGRWAVPEESHPRLIPGLQTCVHHTHIPQTTSQQKVAKPNVAE